jgi:hypothetical protein
VPAWRLGGPRAPESGVEAPAGEGARDDDAARKNLTSLSDRVVPVPPVLSELSGADSGPDTDAWLSTG